MPSPFPGLDPYLEANWSDIHTSLMVYAADAIQEQLPAELFARIDGDDVPPGPEWDEPITERRIEIRDQSLGGQLVTVILVLRPSDRTAAECRARYMQKQREYLDGGVNLVEIDLIHSGQHTVSLPLRSIPKDRRTGLSVCIRRADNPGFAHVYDIPLNRPLPTVAIPLRPTDQEIKLDLQALLTQAYDRGRYAATIDYSQDPDPVLLPKSAEWADGLLRAAGRRQSGC